MYVSYRLIPAGAVLTVRTAKSACVKHHLSSANQTGIQWRPLEKVASAERLIHRVLILPPRTKIPFAISMTFHQASQWALLILPTDTAPLL